MSEVLVSQDGDCRYITLNRPQRLNAINTRVYELLLIHLREAEVDGSVRVVVLTGEGRSFCAGADMKSFEADRATSSQHAYYVSLGQDACKQILRLSKPVVAEVRGHALGGGAELAVSADFLVMAEDAVLGFPETSLGTFVGGGVTYRLPLLIGAARAARLLMLGERVSGCDAQAIGLAYSAPSATELRTDVRSLVGKLSGLSAAAVSAGKAALRDDLRLGYALEQERETLARLALVRDVT